MRSYRPSSDLIHSEAFDLARVALWAAVCGLAYLTGWLDSVTFVALLSIWALVESAWGAYRANEAKRLARIEEKLDLILERTKGPEGPLDS